ncbi:hypothetical protein [Candidatus Magnetobacterium casense]|uniref:ATP-binding protein n=1 Tax=Candidatus Magnetobacterium casense TaxID=1455061 RepID=A0ABS6S0T3_9BACT|nr:hypothetical protein [Candidatus Magnetobacterium casensis]MBV6342003.1 ATP-binding protein [Candidatus Magnetobacterium casensis]
MMENIVGPAVYGGNYLESRKYLVDNLRKRLCRASVLIDAPRRFGKTSVIKEFQRQEQEKERDAFNVLFFDLEGLASVDEFCNKCLEELLKLCKLKNMLTKLKEFSNALLNGISDSIESIETPFFSTNLRERTRNMKPEELKKTLESFIKCLNDLDRKTVLIFDEFPDMLLNIKSNAQSHEDYVKTVNNLTAWLRDLRQSSSGQNKYRFVFCGSINLRKTLDSIGLSKRINDLESLKVPPLTEKEAEMLINALTQTENIMIAPEGLAFLVSKLKDGSPYYGQFMVQVLSERKERENIISNFTRAQVEDAYDEMIHSHSNNLSHFYSRLDDYYPDPLQKDHAKKALKILCNGALDEQQLHTVHFSSAIDADEFHKIVERLIDEGYILEDATDAGKLRFASSVLRDWWSVGRF